MSSQPAAMAEAATAGSTPLHRGLPDEIAIWEILVRLPPKALLRCRAVCRTWRSATSARDFLLTHHGRQPSLPLLYGYNYVDNDVRSMDIIPFDHRAGLIAADQLQSVARLRYPITSFNRKVSCDGLLIVSFGDMHFTVCNPATRQYAHLQQLDGFRLMGMYRYNPTGQYRVLLYRRPMLMGGELAHDAQNGFYIFTLGSGNPPRHIWYPYTEELVHAPDSVLFRGNLHWYIRRMIMVFDTTAESFRRMHAPAARGYTAMFEMDDMMGMSCLSKKEIDIWVLQDYEAEVWAYKYRLELPVAELRELGVEVPVPVADVRTASWDGDVLLLVKFAHGLLHLDINGNLVASFHRRGLCATQLRIKQTLVSHTFFPTQEGYAVNDSPFI